jgi:23S rRNA pseudouridine2605 synthase
VHASLDRQQGDNAWLTLSLTEGKNREIRKLCSHFGWGVSRLIRLSYGPFQLGHLEKGEVEEVPGKVVKEQLGLGKKPEEKPKTAVKSVVKLPPGRGQAGGANADRRRKP